MRRRVPFFWWLSAFFLAFCLAYLASMLLSGCQGAKKVASTLELGVMKGDVDLGGPADEGDVEALTASFRPLAALEPPQEVVVREEAPEPVWPQEPAEGLTEPSDWYRDEGLRDWMERILVLILGALGAVGAQRGVRAYKDRTKEES